jgi:cytochrome c
LLWAILGACAVLHAQGAPQRSIWNGIYTAAQADRGKAVYANHCAKCHGDDLEGHDEVPELGGAHFMADWEDQSIADLVQRIRSTMPLDNPGTLSGASTTDVVTYLMQQNGAPAGSTELPNDSSMQSIIRINQQPPKSAPAARVPPNSPARVDSGARIGSARSTTASASLGT